MNRFLKVGREVLVQIIPVAIGVYLGLIVNDWNSSRQARQRKEHSQELLVQEIKANKTRVEEGLVYHLMLLGSLSSLMQKENPRFKDFGFWKGVRTPTLYSAAYQSATLSSSINTFSLPEVHSMVEAYSAQEKYDAMNLIAMQGLIQQDFFDEGRLRETINFIKMMLTDISFAEKDLLASYRKALEVLETQKK